MSAAPLDPRRARRLLKALRSSHVPEPGDAYWSTFAARLRLRLDRSEAAGQAAFRPRRTRMTGSRLALGLAATLVLAGVIWQAAVRLPQVRDPRVDIAEAARAAGTPSELGTDAEAAAERLEALPVELLERTLDDVVGSGRDDLSGADDLTGEDRRRLLEALRLEVAESSPPQAAYSIDSVARSI